nr:MAG TPA: hypothetical protein [Bacteriophage sp.]
MSNTALGLPSHLRVAVWTIPSSLVEKATW